MHFFIPTPSRSAVGLGPLTIHFYALCILVGVLLALWIGKARYTRAGGSAGDVLDVAIYAIPAGVIGGRIYHVATSSELYFGLGRNPVNALKIWDGGMGIWGAIALGTLVSYFAFVHHERATSFAHFADALAPGILVAQAIGRIGNWFNGELFGGQPTFRGDFSSLPNFAHLAMPQFKLFIRHFSTKRFGVWSVPWQFIGSHGFVSAPLAISSSPTYSSTAVDV